MKTRLFSASLSLLAASCATSMPSRPGVGAVQPWTQGEAMFRADARYLGGDGASSVDLGDGRILWLMHDSFIATRAGATSRAAAVMIGNALGMQHGRNPARARMRFHWRDVDAMPAAFFADEGRHRFWPVSGVVVDGRLTVLMMRVAPGGEGLGFRIDGAKAIRVADPAGEPQHWRIDPLSLPTMPAGVEFGTGGLFGDGDFIVVASADQTAVYLARWPRRAFARGELGDLAWWAGATRGWLAHAQLHGLPAPVIVDRAPEATVHLDARCGVWRHVQVRGFGAGEVYQRSAPALTGPWSTPGLLYHPPESDRGDAMVYQGKAHPEQAADGAWVLTYSTNASRFATLVADDTLYWPRMLRWNPVCPAG